MAIHTRKKTRAAPAQRVSLFVYGTLRRGCRLNGWLSKSKYLGVDAVQGFTLLSLGMYPAMLRMAKTDGQPDKGYQVSGELWSVPVEDFERIRKMEERVGYTTLMIETKGKTEAAAFVFGEVLRTTVEWVEVDPQTCGVQAVAVDDDLPF